MRIGRPFRQPSPAVPPLHDQQQWAILEFLPDNPGHIEITVYPTPPSPSFSFITAHSSRMYSILDQHLSRHDPPLMLRTGFHLRTFPPPHPPQPVLAAEIIPAPRPAPRPRVPIRRPSGPRLFPALSPPPPVIPPKATPWF